jgi:hypothetical protein
MFETKLENLYHQKVSKPKSDNKLPPLPQPQRATFDKHELKMLLVKLNSSRDNIVDPKFNQINDLKIIKVP